MAQLALAAAPMLTGSTTLASIATTLSTVGTIAGGISAIKGQQAKASSAKYNARVAEQNREIEKRRTEQQLEKQDRERRIRLGAQIAGTGGRGTDVGDIIQSSAAQEELDLLTIESEGLLRQNEYANEAALQRSKAKGASSQIPLMALGTIGNIGAGVLNRQAAGVAGF